MSRSTSDTAPDATEKSALANEATPLSEVDASVADIVAVPLE